MSKQADEGKAAQWQSHIQGWQRSGLSQAAYCEQHDLVWSRFCYWRRKLRDSASPSYGFVRVVPKTLPAGLSVRLPSGMEIHGIDDSNVRVVTDLLSRLS